MITGEFQYFAPSSVGEAIKLLEEHGDEAKILAGGHSLLPVMKLRLAQPGVLVDIGNIGELRGITSKGKINIGAMTTYRMIETSEELKAGCGVLAECVQLIGDTQVRNRGTI